MPRGSPTQTRLAMSASSWAQVRDGDPVLRPIFNRHYSARRYRDGRKPAKIVGPGQYIALVLPNLKGLFVWRVCKRDDGQEGVNCAVFRNEKSGLRSAGLILEAEKFAWERWPGRRLFTFVDDSRTLPKIQPGKCFLEAGWRYQRDGQGFARRTKDRGLLILEKLPGWTGIATKGT